ncbi:TIGR04500 family putative peptide maturation system protein [Microtetraspora sp. AC03309]|uniref:TIGR04500 family putative peptide maturation system protein n=1 Tax=Microtetraspora sp. AC03309 TaxID=2779376 RepID=UPI001E3D4D35|nr:TIGR04500 family putative peptide maturation system protein [Microtetraspora sp. AC03309]MCC5577454.1 TIGR04500 family putative peptide maturation system protein [Microtetraspora sp. AC03309]
MDVLDSALAVLESLSGAEPDEAEARLGPLREDYPGRRFRLVWQRETYDGSLHYDLLITHPDGGATVSLSYCPDKALPWPLRGARPAGSNLMLLRVNGVGMRIDQAVACLDFVWDEAGVADRLVTACLIQAALEENPISLDDGELQHAMDAFRRARGLLTATATHDWIARSGLTHQTFERLVRDHAMAAKLRQRVTDGRVEEHYARHRRHYDRARIARFVFPEGLPAEGDLYAMAEASGAEGAFTWVTRGQAPEEVFEAAPGTVIRNGSDVIKVLEVVPAQLTQQIRERAERDVFDAWVAELRRSAKVEWFWGEGLGAEQVS